MYMMIFRVVLMPALVMLSFFTGWRMAVRMIADECQRFGGFVSGNKEFRCISTMQMWLMHECPNKRVYVAGPMTGLPESNYPAFNAAAARLRSKGWHVENPAENPAPHVDAACDWTAYMRMGVSQLMTCHAIYLLPGWQQSKGASLEYMVAKQLGLMVYEHATQDDVLQEQLQALVAKSRKPQARTAKNNASTEEACA
ncbi:DUF4406 domain-containing protein [Comamonas jiangduensis]|uniref:DUF4406 domain-containing protein n=1 Tax=Comamonas jiangduensis TaxID=1194168 RepID=A0ABV4IBB1_9BURK